MEKARASANLRATTPASFPTGIVIPTGQRGFFFRASFARRIAQWRDRGLIPNLAQIDRTQTEVSLASFGKRYCVGFLGNLKYGSLTPEIKI